MDDEAGEFEEEEENSNSRWRTCGVEARWGSTSTSKEKEKEKENLPRPGWNRFCWRKRSLAFCNLTQAGADQEVSRIKFTVLRIFFSKRYVCMGCLLYFTLLGNTSESTNLLFICNFVCCSFEMTTQLVGESVFIAFRTSNTAWDRNGWIELHY
ncbi:hypothetical protein BDZ97DRAFT_65031 [Flammula alnicola]|nr:hypothetical protein BDZ97DRAFT_65031 [Flammula alnicola]